MANLISGDIFVMKGDLKKMYVFLCEHPLPELKDSVICVSVVNSTEDINPRLLFLKSNFEYTPIAKHENMNWIRREIDIISAIYENKEIVAFMEEMRNSNPEIKKEILKELSPSGIRQNIEQRKMLEWLKKSGGKA